MSRRPRTLFFAALPCLLFDAADETDVKVCPFEVVDVSRETSAALFVFDLLSVLEEGALLLAAGCVCLVLVVADD